MLARKALLMKCQCRQPPKAVAEGQHLHGVYHSATIGYRGR